MSVQAALPSAGHRGGEAAVRRPRVLVIAEAANPEFVSVPLAGWSHARALAGVADAHLVTQIRNREAILRSGLGEGEFTAINSEAVARRLWKLGNIIRGGAGKGWTTVTALETLSYYYFERLVWQEFGRRIHAREFDVVHRVTPLSPTMPSLIAARCRRAGVPFVLGPLNGGVPWPRGFDRARRREREWLSYVRDAYKLLPGYGSTRRNASAIMIASRDTWRQMPARYHHKCVYIPENAVDPARFSRRVTGRAGLPIRLVFLGRLVPYKGADMLLEAAAPLIRAGKATVEILGDGPDMGNLKSMIERESLGAGVRMTGWVEHKAIQERLVEADILAFPSIREFGGGVVLEAMMVGLVPVVVDYGGPGELVTPDTGYAIPIGRREEIVARLRAVLERLAADPGSIRPMGERARARVLDLFTWDAKARQVLEVYRWALGERPDKPEPVAWPGAGRGNDDH